MQVHPVQIRPFVDINIIISLALLSLNTHDLLLLGTSEKRFQYILEKPRCFESIPIVMAG